MEFPEGHYSKAGKKRLSGGVGEPLRWERKAGDRRRRPENQHRQPVVEAANYCLDSPSVSSMRVPKGSVRKAIFKPNCLVMSVGPESSLMPSA